MPHTVRDRSHVLLMSLLAGTLVLVVACTTRNMPAAPTGNALNPAHLHEAGPNSSAHDDKGYIDGWFDGQEVQLYYTKSFFCAEPPESGADTHCELGADAQVPPRPGPIPTIYAIAAVGGITPDPLTLACRLGTPCLNHPGMIDASRVGGSATGGPVSHSHILTERRAGWFHTVNIRVRNLDAWNQIAAAKNLQKVRDLQADPNVGGRGLVSADTPTNIFFFIASWRQ